MRRLLLLGICGALTACGGDTDDSNGNAGGSDAGVGGSGNSGGSPGGGGAGNGGDATGGTAQTGGSVGNGGSGGSPLPGDCAAPSGANETTICLTIDPEEMTFETDARFDGSGVLSVELFSIADPPNDGGNPLAAAIYPTDPQLGGEVSLTALPSPRLTVENMPATVYLRVIFFDNADAFQGTGLTAGVWIGGLDLSAGLGEGQTLSPITPTAGAGNEVTVSLQAIRALAVSVDVSATPVGDGEGPLGLVVTNQASITGNPPAFGFRAVPCVDVADLPDTFFMPMVGPGGTYYVTGFLDDLGLGGDFPPGTLAALDVDIAAGTGTIPAVLNLAQTDYTPTASIDLSFVAPLPAEAGAVPPNSCADIAAGQADAGAPDAGP